MAERSAQSTDYGSLYPTLSDTAEQLYPTAPVEDSSITPQLVARISEASEDEQTLALAAMADNSCVDGSGMSLPAGFTEVFAMDGVQIYFIAPGGTVSAPSSPAPLRLCCFNGTPQPGSPSGFLQVDDWTYPLIKGCSPVLHSYFGPYIFPDLERLGCHVGLLLPVSVSAVDRSRLEGLLRDFSALVEQPPVPSGVVGAATVGQLDQTVSGQRRDSTAAIISDGIVKGAGLLSRGLVVGAEKLSVYMNQGTAHVKCNTTAAGSAVPVDPQLQRRLQTARNVTGKALRASEFVVGTVGKGTMALARQLSPHVKKAGTKVLKASGVAGGEHDADSKMDSVLEVASGAVRGLSVVYMGLEQAAGTLAGSLASNTVQITEHRYGEQVGQATESGLHAAGNLAMAGHNVQALGVKSMAKRVAKDTGKQLVQQHQQKKEGRSADPADRNPAL